MSAIRNNSNRSEARKKRSTPYARGFIGTISRFINYFTGTLTDLSAEPEDEDINRRTNGPHPNERQTFVSSPKSDFSSGNRAPLTPSNVHNGSRSALPEPSATHVPNAEQVASYFSQRMGANVTTNEVESMITNLQTTPERERFRFTFTTPISSPSFSSSNISSTASPSASPSKKLARNPNGIYRWEGGGSAKATRQRNRFASPAFGASPLKSGRPTAQESAEQSRLPGQDTKRRKVGDSVSVSDQPPSLNASTSNGVPFPNMTPSTPRTNGVLRQTSPLPSRLRTPAKLSAPFNPSPLRQAWSDASSTSSHEDNKPTKPTKAANLVAELIKETAPSNKPDLSNPYQTASPVGKVGPPRRGTKRPRAVGRPPLPTKEQKAEEEKKKAEEQKKKEEEEKLKALSAQAIIEATLPKGSKRSRPPAHLENQPAGFAPRSPSPTPHSSSVPTETVIYTVEETEDSRPEKKSRSCSEDPSQAKAILADVTVEEIEVDMDMDKGRDPVKSSNSTTQLSRSAQFQSFKPNSIPREPSKLRFSFQAESSSSSPTPTSIPVPLPPLSSEDQLPSASTTVPTPAPPPIQAVSNGFDFSFKSLSTPVIPKEEEPESTVSKSTKSSDFETVKAQVRALDTKALPTFTLSSTGSTAFSVLPEHANARDAANAIHFSSLPSFSFTSTFLFDSANPLPVKESSSDFKPFPGIKVSTTSSPNIFGTLPSKSSAAPTASTPLKSFDFAAAGMKPPSVARDTWNCTQCGLSSPQDAIKCTICDEPKRDPTISIPPATLPPFTVPKAQPVKAFDWAGAGLKAPTPSNDTWICGECTLSNPISSTKCTICDEPRRGSTISTPPAVPPSFAAVAPKSQPVKSFDWSRAGLKAPIASDDTWKCGECALSNPKSAAKCTICDADAPGIASSTTGSAAVSSTNMFVEQVSKSVISSSGKDLLK